MKFAFIAKHRAVWPVAWMCSALGVSRSGFHAWLTRPPSQRARDDEAILAKVRTSFVGSDRTYGARRVWHDVLAEGMACGLHRIERIMRQNALRARPRRRRDATMRISHEAISVAEIAKRLGISRKTFYGYFPQARARSQAANHRRPAPAWRGRPGPGEVPAVGGVPRRRRLPVSGR